MKLGKYMQMAEAENEDLKDKIWIYNLSRHYERQRLFRQLLEDRVEITQIKYKWPKKKKRWGERFADWLNSLGRPV